MELNTLQEKIFQIREKLVNYKENCSGVTVDRGKGIIPRCLVLEVVSHNDEEIGSVIVGITLGNQKTKNASFTGIEDRIMSTCSEVKSIFVCKIA